MLGPWVIASAPATVLGPQRNSQYQRAFRGALLDGLHRYAIEAGTRIVRRQNRTGVKASLTTQHEASYLSRSFNSFNNCDLGLLAIFYANHVGL